MLVYLLFFAGLALLLIGGEWLVKGAVGLAEKLSISPLIIGLTIVALGTSAPELLISLKAALNGSGALAVGNVVGSNIANVLLVLGVPAFIATAVNDDDDLKPTLFLLVGLTIAFMAQLHHGPINRIDGILLLVVLFAFLWQQFMAAKAQSAGAGGDADPDYLDEVGTVPSSYKVIALFMGLGIVALPIGANLTVDAAVEIAMRWNVSEDIIGLTIVAIGTSLPELATGIMAARQGNTSVAIGNVIGSNLFNIAAIMGVTATVAGIVPVGAHVVSFDMWVMLAATLALAYLTLTKTPLNKTLAVILSLSYVLYLVITATI